jgi:hypothetical protein
MLREFLGRAALREDGNAPSRAISSSWPPTSHECGQKRGLALKSFSLELFRVLFPYSSPFTKMVVTQDMAVATPIAGEC